MQAPLFFLSFVRRPAHGLVTETVEVLREAKCQASLTFGRCALFFFLLFKIKIEVYVQICTYLSHLVKTFSTGAIEQLQENCLFFRKSATMANIHIYSLKTKDSFCTLDMSKTPAVDTRSGLGTRTQKRVSSGSCVS